MNIRLTKSQLSRIISENIESLNEYSEKTMNFLVNKYMSQGAPNEQTVRQYIKYFENNKGNVDSRERDIMIHDWQDLKWEVEYLEKEKKSRIRRAGVPNFEDSKQPDLVYNQNNMFIFRAKDRKACVRYGHGRNFCISGRGLLGQEWYDEYVSTNQGVPYFVFNKNLQESDPRYLLVVITYPSSKIERHFTKKMTNKDDDKNLDLYKRIRKEHETELEYSVTTADNKLTNKYNSFKGMIKDYPELKSFKNIFTVI